MVRSKQLDLQYKESNLINSVDVLALVDNSLIKYGLK